MWFKADKVGTYRGQCTELCGRDHGFMPIVVEVMEAGRRTTPGSPDRRPRARRPRRRRRDAAATLRRRRIDTPNDTAATVLVADAE